MGLYPWSKKDTTAATNAAVAEGATQDRFTTYIQRLSKADRLPPQQAAGEARKVLEFPNGSSWDGKGMFLIPNTRLESTLQKLNEIRDKFYQTVEALVARLPKLEEKARLDLNGAFHRLGFPTASDLQGKYYFRIRQSAIVSANDIRLNHVSPAARLAIEESTKKQQEEQTAELHKECLAGMERVVRRVAETLPAFSDGKISRFEDTLITGLVELCEALPALNVTKDTNIDRILGRIQALGATLAHAEQAKILRSKDDTGKKARKELATTASGILDALKKGHVTK